MDPKDILGADLHPNAAIPSPHDPRDHQWEEVGYGTAPFDWSVGYDIEAEMTKALNASFTEPTKDQGQSGSCGGQATSYLGGTFSVFQNKRYEEKSAKFIYAPVAYPGGGSIGRDLCDRILDAGWAPEVCCPSYEAGHSPPSESFMERVSDISDIAKSTAARNKGISYAAVNTDIDSVAQALSANKGLFIGVRGANNGTWVSAMPKPPVDGQELWGHWLKVGKAKIIDGVKYIGVHNSWGMDVGENGWQWLSEDYFKTVVSAGPVIFEARVIVYNPNPTTPAVFHHTFTTPMQSGDTGPEVKALQTALQIDGEFPTNVAPTGFYGSLTFAAVQKFQAKYGIATAGLPTTTGYGKVGPKTLAKLNQLFQ